MRLIKVADLVTSSVVAVGLFIIIFADGDRLTATVSPDPVWEAVGENSTAVAQPDSAAESCRVALNTEALGQLLARAPMQSVQDLRQSPAVLALPMPDGSFQRFYIEESPVLDAALAARYPAIKSYRGQGIDDGTATMRFDWTPLGFHALVLSAGRPAVHIQPAESKDLTVYTSSYDRRVAFNCGVDEKDRAQFAARPAGPNGAVGTTLRTERLAVAATWEFCNALGGDTLANTIATINAILNSTNAIYERELSIHLNLVNAPNIIYASNNPVCGPGHNIACNSGNDPYTNSNPSTMLDEGQVDFEAKVGSANYDVGHILATGTSGIATTGVVCSSLKSRGASAVFPGAGISGTIGIFAHELGHQHGAHHSFNGTTSNCDGNRNNQTSWEPGSGTTLMSYAGLCGSDNVASLTEQRFFNGSFNEIVTYLAGAGCGSTSATGNNVPTVDAGPPRTIPKLTPFTLTATGTDADAADVPNLTFVWEQIDAGEFFYFNPPYGDQAGDPSTTTRPLFRSFSPTTDKSRTFPSLTYILNNANVPPPTVGGFQTAENLPAVSRTMNFRATVRDNRSGFGGVNDSSVAITVDGNAGPFAITSPNGGGTLSGAQTVTWNVNNTNLAPVGCANITISLSTDGGLTFPITLAASTPNDGSQTVTLPNGILSSTARIKVAAVGNIFFDISDGNFALTPGDSCPAISNTSPTAGSPGSSVTITGINFMNGGNVTGVKFANNVAASFSVVNDTTITATVPAGAVGGPITVSKAGCADVQSAGFTVCAGAPVTLAIDDGVFNTAGNNGNGAYYVNRLTPASYPAILQQVSIFWDPNQNFPPGSSLNIVAGSNPSGASNINGISFQSFAGTAGAQPGFTNFTLPQPLTITSGDFVVGFQVPTVIPPGAPIAFANNAPVSRSYQSSNGTSFNLVTFRNYMIRAQIITNCSAPPPPPTPTPTPAPTATAAPTSTPTATPATGLVGNVSTRLPVGTGDNVLIEGFIVQGPAGSTKKIMVRAIGPSLIPFGIADAVANPTLEIRDSAGALLATNDDWMNTVVGGLISGDQSVEISASGLAPTNNLESALIADLVPGSYTAIVRGLNNTTGTGVVDAYDLSAASPAKLANIATRGLIQPGDQLMIAGFIIQNAPVRAVVRAIGPSLVAFGIPNALPNTTLQLRDQNGAILRENDDWRTTQQTELEATGLQPSNDLEAALVDTLPPGQYTAQVRGNPESTGIGVVQVYFLQ
jgi:hypothetical protein